MSVCLLQAELESPVRAFVVREQQRSHPGAVENARWCWLQCFVAVQLRFEGQCPTCSCVLLSVFLSFFCHVDHLRHGICCRVVHS